jgi:hypothetical protein
MAASVSQPSFDLSRPMDLGSADFANHKYEWYRWLLEEAPACMGKVSVLRFAVPSSHLEIAKMVGWHRHVSLPVALK